MELLHVECSGQGQPLVLLHGWSMNSAVWHPILAELEKQYSVYRVDLPGHGANDELNGESNFNGWLAAVMAVVPAQASWLGWSLGATLALAIAARFPERVSRLVLVAGTVKFVVADDWSVAVPLKTWQRFVKVFQEDPELASQQFMQLQSLGVIGSRQLGRDLQQMQTKGGKPSAQGLLLGLQFLQEVDLRDALKQVQCPAQLLLGEHDKLVPAAVAAEMQVLNPNIQASIIEGASHVPFISHPAEFLATLKHND